jgi:large subunit ribosomal protein LP2
MKYIAAYALLVLGGKANPSAADLENVLKEAGVKADADHVAKLVTMLKDKKLHELISEGKKKIGAASAVAVVSAPSKKEEKVVEKPKEEEAADVDMGGLFGGDDY